MDIDVKTLNGEFKLISKNSTYIVEYNNGEIVKVHDIDGNSKEQEFTQLMNNVKNEISEIIDECKIIDNKKIGTITYKNGDKYIGEFSNDGVSFSGIIYYHNGDIYEGSTINNQCHGKGVYVFNDGQKQTGIFENDNLIKGTINTTNKIIILNGDNTGIILYNDGSFYEGGIQNMLKHGKGVVLTNGKNIAGIFDNDNLNGIFKVDNNYVKYVNNKSIYTIKIYDDKIELSHEKYNIIIGDDVQIIK